MSRTLEQVRDEALGCTSCGLARGRTQVVFGVGRSDADLMFIGEAPGMHEDRQGEPFVGRAGALLTTLLEGIGRAREHVYIANVVKCRPPNNRDPMPEEIMACKPWLKEQIALVDPRVICTLGNFATKLLLGTSTGITRLRGQRFDWRGRVLVPTFHPAAVLRGGQNQMSRIQDDFRLLATVLDGASGAPAEPEPTEPRTAVEAEQLGLF
jgi:DNA polymerase